MSPLKKGIFILLAILLLLFVMEFSLRMGGYFFSLQAKKGEVTKKISRVSQDSLPILCVGDSFTFGAGAKKGYSYPEQLQKLIKEENMQYTVYNLGVTGMNSSTLLLELPKWIELYKPKIVIALIGSNDIWNFQNSKYYLFQKGIRAYIYRLENFLFKFRTYKLFKILAMNISKLISRQSGTPPNATPVKRVGPKPEIEEKVRLAYQYFNQERDFNKVKEIVQNVRMTDPQNDEAYLLLGWTYEDSGEFKLAEENLKKAIEINPCNLEAHRQLFRLYRHFDKNELAKGELELMLRLSPKNEELNKFKRFGIPWLRDDDLFFKQLKYNLMQIINLLKSKKIILVLQIYPRPYPSYTTRIKDICHEYNIVLVDNETTFSGLSYKDYFIPDGHPNGQGYSLIAKNVFEVLRKIDDKTTP